MNASNSIDKKTIETIKKVNARLRAADLPASIRTKSKNLYVRFTGPAKSECGQETRKQWDYPVGVKAALPAGIKKAENLAKEIGGKLANGTFSWNDYPGKQANAAGKASHGTIPNTDAQNIIIKVAIDLFELKYFAAKEDNATTRESYKKNCTRFFKKLPQDKFVTQKVLEEAIESSTQPDTYNRSQLCNLCKRLVKLLRINDIDVAHLRGKYSIHGNAKPIKVPSDALIEECYFKITDPLWRKIYAVLVVYGLRPHEIAYINRIEGDGTLYLHTKLRKVNDAGIVVHQSAKTGGRYVMPLRPEWFERFGLDNLEIPNIKFHPTNSKYGQFVHRMIRQAMPSKKLPFCLYALRHAWALRAALDYGMDHLIAAKMMGHSLAVHLNTYLRWIPSQRAKREYKRCIENPIKHT